MRVEILIAEIGGQGVVYAANLIARPPRLRGRFVAACAHYGRKPRLRHHLGGGHFQMAIDYPMPNNPMSLSPCTIRLRQGKEQDQRNGMVITDSTLVNVARAMRPRLFPFPAQLARKRLNNITRPILSSWAHWPRMPRCNDVCP